MGEEQEDEITVNELTHDEKVEKLEDTIKILQQQMAEGNDHIEYELKMKEEEKRKRRKEEKDSSPHRKAFKPPRRVSKTPEKAENPKKGILKQNSAYKTPEKQSRGSHKEEDKIKHLLSPTLDEPLEETTNSSRKGKSKSPSKQEQRRILCSQSAELRAARAQKEKTITPDKELKQSTPNKKIPEY